MGSLVRILAVLERDECLVLVEGEEVTKPSWDNAPEWANFLTVNDIGYWQWWEFPPYWCYAERWEETGVWLRSDDCVERNGYGRVEVAGEPPAHPTQAIEARP